MRILVQDAQCSVQRKCLKSRKFRASLTDVLGIQRHRRIAPDNEKPKVVGTRLQRIGLIVVRMSGSVRQGFWAARARLL
jgi:hypothetical protein